MLLYSIERELFRHFATFNKIVLLAAIMNRPCDRKHFGFDLVSASGQNDPDMGPSAVWDKMVASKIRKFVEIESILRFPSASASPTDAEKLL